MSEAVLWVLLLLPAFVAGAVTYAVFRWAFGAAQQSASSPEEPADPEEPWGIPNITWVLQCRPGEVVRIGPGLRIYLWVDSVDRGIARLVIRVPSRFPVERMPQPPAACLSQPAAIEVPNN